MTDFDERLNELESLHQQVMDALVRNESEKVQSLVTRQYACVRDMAKNELSDADGTRLLKLQESIQRQNSLIEQAADVANYFLSRFYQMSSFDRRA